MNAQTNLPPHNEDSECAALGSMLIDPDSILLVRDVWTDRIESAYLPEVIKEQAARWNESEKRHDIARVGLGAYGDTVVYKA